MARLKLKDIYKSYNDTDVITGIDLEIAHGEFVVFVGPSGCGKSTLLRTLMGHITPTDGSIGLAGHDVTRASPAARSRAGIGYVPQVTVGRSLRDLVGVHQSRGGEWLTLGGSRSSRWRWAAVEPAASLPPTILPHRPR